MPQAASTYLGEQRRRSTRIQQTLPLIVRGMDLLGQPFEERTATQTLSFHGCRYASKHHLPKNTWITLEVPSGHGQQEPLRVRARVAWIQRPHTLRELFQVGVELETGGNIGGIAFPPEDWTSSRIEGPALVNAETHSTASTMAKKSNAPETAAQEGLLESYLEKAWVESATKFSRDPAQHSPQFSVEDHPLLRELRKQFESRSHQVLEQARATAEQLVVERTRELQSELHNTLNNEQQVTAEAFYEKWRREFENGKADTKEQISLELAKHVAEQITRVRHEVHESLNTAWSNRLERAESALSESERRSEMLRQETRAASEAAVIQAEQRLNEKLSRQLAELQAELASRAPQIAPAEQPSGANTFESEQGWRSRWQQEMKVAETQWHELIESSVESAVQRLALRMADGSQHILHSAEQKLAVRVAELQQESDLTAEGARAALDEVKSALDQEVARMKISFEKIEQTSAHFSEYSAQLEAASQDSLNELRKRLESSVGLHTAELDRRAAELQKQSMDRAGAQLEEMSRRAAARTTGEIEGRIRPSLERAAEVARELSASEQRAEEIFHVHRERLRQISEQAQRDATGQVASALANQRDDIEVARRDALMKWTAELDASASRTAEEVSRTLATAREEQLRAASSQLDARVGEAITRAQASMDEAAAKSNRNFRAAIGEIGAAQIESAHNGLEAAAREKLESTKNQLERATEAAAAAFGDVIQRTAGDAAQKFTAESDATADQGRTRLIAAAEEMLKGLQVHAQNSFDHFQEQMAIQAEKSLAQSSQNLASQLGATLDVFHERSQAQLAEYSAKQVALDAEALERHENRLRSAGNSCLDSAMRDLDVLVEKRMDSLVRGAEDAMRRACVSVFDGVAQAMKEKLLDAFNAPRTTLASPVSEDTSHERRASA